MSNYNRKDHLFERAKSEGYRSRAAYKLQELQNKLRLIQRGNRILDLGAWPGGWLQVASELVGPTGLVVGIDLQRIEAFPVENIKAVVGDITDQVAIDEIARRYGPFDGVISDLSPKLTGLRDVDNAAVEHLAESALAVATGVDTEGGVSHPGVVKDGGFFVIKLFKSSTAASFMKRAKPLFERTRCFELDASRSTSNEFYFVAQGKKKVVHDARSQHHSDVA